MATEVFVYLLFPARAWASDHAKNLSIGPKTRPRWRNRICLQIGMCWLSRTTTTGSNVQQLSLVA